MSSEDEEERDQEVDEDRDEPSYDGGFDNVESS